MRYFLDTEFIESGPYHPIQLISLGLVAETGQELYAVSDQYDPEDASQWVKENVLPHVGLDKVRPAGMGFTGPLSDIALEVRAFVEATSDLFPGRGRADAGPLEFWGYYADYDWVVFCQLFGAMIALPPGWPMYCRDLKQWADDLGVRLPKQEGLEHHALYDARWNRDSWNLLDRVQCPSSMVAERVFTRMRHRPYHPFAKSVEIAHPWPQGWIDVNFIPGPIGTGEIETWPKVAPASEAICASCSMSIRLNPGGLWERITA